MTWPFGCRGCKAKDSEIGFLRGFLASARTVVRDSAPQPEPADPNSPEMRAAYMRLMNPGAPADEPEDRPQHFSRNPIQFADPVKPSNDDAEGVPA